MGIEGAMRKPVVRLAPRPRLRHGPGLADQVLSIRDLNRALLARQMLLRRETVTPTEALGRLLALQAQLPRAPFIGLWSRIDGFEKSDLLDAIRARAIVRATLMRGTLHLATAEDVLAFRHTVMPSREVTLPGGHRPPPEVLQRALDLAAKHFFTEPRDFESIREVLEAEGLEPVRPLAWAARVMLPLVQADAETAWGHTPGGEFVMAKAWLGQKADPTPHPAALARRYLAAYGPATPANFAAWSGLQGAAATFAELAPELVTFKDEQNRTLYDLPDAPRPPADTAAPARLLPEFDAAVLIKESRARIVAPAFEAGLTSKNLIIPATALVDGFVVGTWKAETKRKITTVAVKLFKALATKHRKALEAEALALANFLDPATTAAVAFEDA
jgi:hypothetical protein